MTSNGQLASGSLVSLSTPGRLGVAAGASYERLRFAAGVTGTTYANHAYRDLDEQERIFEDNYQTTYTEYEPGKVDKRGPWEGTYWYRKAGHAPTAVPGTSNHGWGKAVDWQNLGGYGSSSWNRFANVAVAHGWNNDEGRRNDEAWHWVYNESKDTHRKEPGVELDERIDLTDGMRSIAGWSADYLTVEGALGYLASGTWGTAVETNGLLAWTQRVEGILNDLVDTPPGSVALTPADIDAIAEAVTERVLARIQLTGTVTLSQVTRRRRFGG